MDNLNLLTFKPVLYVCNVDAGSVLKGNRYVTAVKESVKDESSEVILIATAIEADIAEFEDFDERKFLLNEIGLSEPGVNYLIQATYKLLNLQTFFTAGKKEVKAWTVTKGTKAPQAAGVIHTDFENGFIRAEVISFNDFINLKSEQACRDAGKLISQGKEYVVCEGDIIHFRFNV